MKKSLKRLRNILSHENVFLKRLRNILSQMFLHPHIYAGAKKKKNAQTQQKTIYTCRDMHTNKNYNWTGKNANFHSFIQA